jgi:hypothetical protein
MVMGYILIHGKVGGSLLSLNVKLIAWKAIVQIYTEKVKRGKARGKDYNLLPITRPSF